MHIDWITYADLTLLALNVFIYTFAALFVSLSNVHYFRVYKNISGIAEFVFNNICLESLFTADMHHASHNTTLVL